ncbi:RNA polymerase sigma factor, sigma-70 family [Mucilaginibacter pineti]|uniref:RNA polymerase sigma factor, sigma-70 family n=1 Tax=Mucilaginibacter pineti TaxID=1391627 RepID=A0A1G7P537_9SPHI|nr:sigma-70 family RNA polymerase sigma factor [Mucilaginibacter pineti]SDF81446.1 RNA polymerase sigma factor, sigma-70 family [Mucilaginibacter pineti]
MVLKASVKITLDLHFIDLLKSGKESGLKHFYNRLYPVINYWAFKRVKDDVAASSIAHEAFLKLWLLRSKMNSANEIITFLGKQVKCGCNDFYKKSSAKFHRGLIKLDDIENYQDFMGANEPQDEIDLTDITYQEELDQLRAEQWQEVESVLPNLSANQQLFIKLCLQYSFSYDRIAWHLGGISDYEIARKVEDTLKNLKDIIINTKKLNLTKTSKFLYEGELNEEQANILNLRYDLNFSFEEIASELGLSQGYVQTVFVKAFKAIKKVPNNKNQPPIQRYGKQAYNSDQKDTIAA